VSGNFITRAALFRDAQNVRYLVGRYLLQDSVNTGIYRFSDPAAVSRVRDLPLATDPVAQSSQSFLTLRAGGKPYVAVVAGTIPGGLYLLDVSNVAAISQQTVAPPAPYNEITAVAFDPVREQLAVAYFKAGQVPLVVIWAIQSGAAVEVVRGQLGQLTRVVGLALNDGLVAASGAIAGSNPETRTTYLSSFGSNTAALSWSTHQQLSIASNFSSDGKVYAVSLANNLVLPAGSDLLLYRSGFELAEWWRVPLELLDPSPHASFTVTGGSAAATCAGVPTAPSQGNAASGFPGDTFTVVNTSYGDLTGAGLTIEPATGTFVTTPQGWNWTPPASATPGEYRLTVTVSGPLGSDSLTRSVWLCNEAAALGISADLSNYLVGEQATLSGAGSQGYPSSFDFVLPAGVSSTGSPTGVPPPGTLPITFNACGTFTIRAVARYPHAGADSGCGGWYTDSRPTLHDACAELSPRLVAPARSTFVAKQNGTATTQPLVSTETVLEFTGKVAPGYTPTFVWSYPGVTGCQYVNAASGYTGSTCRILAGTLTPGQPVALTLTVQLSPAPPSPCAGNVTSAITTLNPYAATAGFQAAPITAIVGQTVSLVLEDLSGTFTSLRYGLGGAATCSGATSIQVPSIFGGYSNGDTVGIQLTTPGTWTITLYGTPSGGTTEVTLDSTQVTIVLPAAPALAAPSSAAYGATYTVSWSATSPGNGYELQEAADPSFVVADSWSVSGTSRQFTHAPVSTSTYYYRSRAAVSCGGTQTSAWSSASQTAVQGSTLEVTAQTITTTVTYVAPLHVLAGPSVTVTNPGQLTLRAGVQVVLRNGFSVGSGARLTATLDPSLIPPT
jgi:hypothetical protein